MSRLLWLGLLLVAVLLPVLPGPTPAQAAKKGRAYAFLVACSGYSAGEFHALPHTIAEMKEFRAALIGTGYEADDIVFLHDGQADRRYLSEKKKIVKELGLLLGRLRKEDSVLVALNGHGLHFKGDTTGYFLPVDAEFDDKGSMLAMGGKGGLFERMQECKAGRKLLIVNACRNEVLAKNDFAARKVKIDDGDEETVPEGIAALYSCKAGQGSFFYPEGKGPKVRRSLFYHHLIEAWQGNYAGIGATSPFACAMTSISSRRGRATTPGASR